MGCDRGTSFDLGFGSYVHFVNGGFGFWLGFALRFRFRLGLGLAFRAGRGERAFVDIPRKFDDIREIPTAGSQILGSPADTHVAGAICFEHHFDFIFLHQYSPVKLKSGSQFSLVVSAQVDIGTF